MGGPLYDPEVLRRCIPGCLSLTKESDERMRATVDVRIGPIGARFSAFGARVKVRSVRGAREIAAADLYLGPYSTALEPDELITAIRFSEAGRHPAPCSARISRAQVPF